MSIRTIAAAVICAVGACVAHAQSYPAKTIRLILPFPAGAPSDLVGRTIGQKMGEQMGQQLVPDNRTGAGGTLGLSIVAKAPADGYTVLVSSPTIALSPLLYSNLSYDVARDFAPVARLASIENVMLVHPTVPSKTLKDFIALARSRPGKLNYGSGGPGTTNHLANELLKSLEKIDMVHVPYKGATLATTALMGGEVDQVIVSVASVLPLIKAGRVRPLAVLSEKRVATLPNVPTSTESGFPNFKMSIWYGMFAPAGTPKEIVDQLNAHVRAFVANPDSKKHYDTSFLDPLSMTAPEFAALVKADADRWQQIVRETGIKQN